MSNFQRIPPDPEGHGPDAVWLRQFKKFVIKNWIRNVKGGRLIPDPSGGNDLVIEHPNFQPAKRFSFPWQTPNKELDPRVAVARDTFVYVSAANPISTTGLIDLVIGGATRVKVPGSTIWQAAKDVPAQVRVGGVVKYNVPQNPDRKSVV